MKEQKILCILAAAVLTLFGCGAFTADREKQNDLKYEMVDIQSVPEKLSEQIEKKKQDPFFLAYGEGDWLYIAVGYGKKETGGYYAEVKEVYETKNTVFVKTSLTGTGEGEEKEETVFPYIVFRIPYTEKRIISEI